MMFFEKRNTNSIEMLHVASFVAYGIVFLTPIIERNTSALGKATVVGILLMTTFITVVAARKQSGAWPVYFWVLLWFSVLITYKALGLSTCTWGKAWFSIVYLSIIPAAVCVIECLSANAKRILFICYIIILAVNICSSIFVCLAYPNASEMLNFDATSFYSSLNVGGSSFTMVAALAACVLLAFMLGVENSWRKAIVFPVIIVCALFVLIAQRMITILIMGFGFFVIALLWKERGKRARTKVGAFLLCLGIAVVLLPMITVLIECLASTTYADERIGARLYELVLLSPFSSEDGGIDGFTGSGRIPLYAMSCSTFVSSPMTFFFGIGDVSSVVAEANSLGVGSHSEVFDALAEHGVIGAVVIAGMLATSYRALYRPSEVVGANSIFLAIYSLFIVDSFLNNTFEPGIFLAVYLFAPLCLDMMTGVIDDSSELIARDYA